MTSEFFFVGVDDNGRLRESQVPFAFTNLRQDLQDFLDQQTLTPGLVYCLACRSTTHTLIVRLLCEETVQYIPRRFE